MVKFTIGSFLNVQVSGIKYIQKLSWACPAPFLPWVLNMEVRPLETSCSLKAHGRVPIGSVSQILGRCLSVFIPCSLSTFFLCPFFSLLFLFLRQLLLPDIPSEVLRGCLCCLGSYNSPHPSIPVSASIPGLEKPWTCRRLSYVREGQSLVVSLWATFVPGQLSSSYLSASHELNKKIPPVTLSSIYAAK